MEAQDLELDGYTLHEKVISHSTVLPCFTTPAPTEAGRSAPKRMKGRIDPEAKTRWLQDSRTYAPWHYAEEAMARSPEGQLVTLPTGIKEVLHGLPKNFTDVQGVATRHRMVANGWHIGVIQFLLLMMLQPVATQPVPLPRVSTLEWVIGQVQSLPPGLGPGLSEPKPNCIPPAGGEWEHWELARHAKHPLLQPAHLSPGLQQAVDLCKRWAHDIDRIRQEVVDEVITIIEDRASETEQWWSALAPHVASVYFNKGHNQITQIPIFSELLQRVGYSPDDPLFQDLNQGFSTIGRLHGGTGWLPRCDSRYQHPIDEQSFLKLNRTHVEDRLRHYRVDEHWRPMLDELKKELEMGRLQGPFCSRGWWPRPAIGIEGSPMLPSPEGIMTAAFSFSVYIRRYGDAKIIDVPCTTLRFKWPMSHLTRTSQSMPTLPRPS